MLVLVLVFRSCLKEKGVVVEKRREGKRGRGRGLF